ncbi:MAG: homoserine dehydrogenase [Anaerolineales bacterium]|jgi:homoserine dehydrogenase|nr:homoserine dehydrogenase [Anaerolineales bacterium]MDX9937309.1 homoserine dehydrogenase [Anaerolineales bacterium]GER80444.1 homoserine dehydrogenase [Candidatus Denitrolinea symbiosum]
MRFKLCFIGFGNVARALANLLVRKNGALESKYGITYSVTGIATGRHGFAVNANGLDVKQALALAEQGRSISALSAIPVKNSLDVIRLSSADVIFENSPVNYDTGQPAIDHVRAALEAGAHAVTANKGAVVHAYRELTELARSKGRRFLFESTVLGGSPLFSTFREALPLAELISFKGIINATTNIILSRMEDGETFEEAVKYCQGIGIAETDPSGDVDGWDASIKVAALATVLMDAPLKPQDVDRTGIREVTSAMVAQARRENKRWKLVASAAREGSRVRAHVAPELVDAASPLYGMMGSSAGLTFRTDVLPDYSVTMTEREGLKGGPEETAYGLFADFIAAVTK